ncbi:ribonuclease H-like domain-containing protein [Tanacetum coccineum]
MVMRFRVRTNRPTKRLILHVYSVSPLPKYYRDAFNDLNWQNSMCDEYNALIKNKTCTLVPRHPNTNIVLCMWFFHHKYLADGSLSRYKARFVANVYQFDVNNAFLHGDLTETVYMHQPSGFQDSQHPAYVCLLQQSLYGLKQAPRAWFQRFASYITRVGFQHRMFLSQKKYVFEILERAHMVTCNPSQTPIDTESKLGADGHSVCLYMHDPREPYFSALKWILRYVQGTLDYGLQLFSSSTIDLVAYSDADWAGCPATRRSTSNYCVFLGNNLLSCSSKCQSTLSRSNTEAEYRGVANAVAETCWLRNLLRELHTPLSFVALVYCDNASALYLSCNPVQHQRTKHIEIDIHFVRDLVVDGHVRVLHVPSRYQFADIFTKGLSSALFEEFRSSLSIRCPPAPTAEEC